MALGERAMEPVDRRPDDRGSRRPEPAGKIVGEGGLAGGIGAVDRNAAWVLAANRRDPRRDLAEDDCPLWCHCVSPLRPRKDAVPRLVTLRGSPTGGVLSVRRGGGPLKRGV